MLFTTVLPVLLLANAPPDTGTAIDKGIKRLEEAAANYPKHRDCFSCHHQALPIMALSRAKEKGFRVDEALVEKQVKFTLDSFRPKLKEVCEGKGVGGSNTTCAYALRTLEAAGHASDDVTAALVQFLLKRQKDEDSWPAVTKRPPSEGSPFTNTALALRAFKRYSSDDPELKERIAKAARRGRAWLEENEPKDTEDRVFRLLGLIAAEADKQQVDVDRDELLKQQFDDGSWAQLPDGKGDAYATGSALVALWAAGLSPKTEAYERGVKYLLTTQDASGSWLVETRSRPVQTFFENGDPGGKSQFISTTATGWAVLALLEATDRKR
jgi:bacterioferritin-associated ferredoxin